MGGNPESARRLFSLGRWHDNGFVASARDGILERKKNVSTRRRGSGSGDEIASSFSGKTGSRPTPTTSRESL